MGEQTLQETKQTNTEPCNKQSSKTENKVEPMNQHVMETVYGYRIGV